VARYLVESYLADTPTALEQACRSARLLTELDRDIQYVRTTFLPGEESVFHVFEATSSTVVIAAADQVALPVDRISEAFEDDADDSRTQPGTSSGSSRQEVGSRLNGPEGEES
jgi:hypothetical protein